MISNIILNEPRAVVGIEVYSADQLTYVLSGKEAGVHALAAFGTGAHGLAHLRLVNA